MDGSLIYSKCGDPSTCIARKWRSWVFRSIDKKGTNDIWSGRFNALDSSGFLQTGPLVLGGALQMECQTCPNVDVTVSIGVEVNRQVRVAASATLKILFTLSNMFRLSLRLTRFPHSRRLNTPSRLSELFVKTMLGLHPCLSAVLLSVVFLCLLTRRVWTVALCTSSVVMATCVSNTFTACGRSNQ